MRVSLEDRFFAKVDVHDCWWWTASLNTHGYGQIKVEGHVRPAHRVAWELLVGPLHSGLHLDHLCRNRKCVNPDHLEVVTQAENTRRGAAATVTRARRAAQTTCKRGHSLAVEHVYINPRGERICRVCRAAHKFAGGASALLGLIERN